jgi:hypothetical protein
MIFKKMVVITHSHADIAMEWNIGISTDLCHRLQNDFPIRKMVISTADTR